jgi:hypothetical protein
MPSSHVVFPAGLLAACARSAGDGPDPRAFAERSLRGVIDYRRAEPAADTARWTGALVLGRSGAGFVVRDVEFRAPWAFKPGPGLRAVLRAEPDSAR